MILGLDILFLVSTFFFARGWANKYFLCRYLQNTVYLEWSLFILYLIWLKPIALYSFKFQQSSCFFIAVWTWHITKINLYTFFGKLSQRVSTDWILNCFLSKCPFQVYYYDLHLYISYFFLICWCTGILASLLKICPFELIWGIFKSRGLETKTVKYSLFYHWLFTDII